MKKLLSVCGVCVMLCGCGTTFQERKEIYQDAYLEVKQIAPLAARLFMDRLVKDGKISQAEADAIVNAISGKTQE